MREMNNIDGVTWFYKTPLHLTILTLVDSRNPTQIIILKGAFA